MDHLKLRLFAAKLMLYPESLLSLSPLRLLLSRILQPTEYCCAADLMADLSSVTP